MDHEKRAHLLSIGEMAEANRVSIATLRLYDRMGLLQPSYRDEETNYRYYNLLDMVVLTAEMRELKAMHEAVERTIQSIERYRKSPVSGTISLEFIDQRHILYIPCAENFYEQGIVAYEKAVLALRRELMGRNLPQLLSYSLGTSVKQDDFARGALIADKIFIFGDKHLRDYGDSIEVIESGMFACAYLDDFDEEAEGAERLLAYCRANHYILNGDYICEEMTELNLFDNKKRNMFLRLQVPVIFTKN